MSTKPILSLCFCAALSLAQAQNIFVLPGANSTNSNVQVFTPGFIPLNSLQAGSGAYQVFALPDGSKYYFVANSGSQTVTAVDSTFANTRTLGNLGRQATGAALTPDGRRLLVVAGTLHVFDTSTDTDLTPNGILSGNTLTDIAVSLDGTRAFVLGSSPTGVGSAIYAVDLSSFSVVGTFQVLGVPSGIAVGPNGLVYVGTRNLLYEIDPTTVAPTSAGTIPLNADPGKIAFTPDGKYALFPNRTPNTGGSVILVDLNSHSFTTPTQANGGVFNIVFDRLLVVSNNLAYAYGSQDNTLYQVAIPSLQIGATSFNGVPAVSTTAASLSPDVTSGTHASAQNLYLVSGSNLIKVDIPSNQVIGSLPLTIASAGAIGLAGPQVSNGTVAAVLQYGDKQAVVAGGTSLPIVVRAVDASGNPLYNIPVSFTAANVGSVVFKNPNPTTGLTGYASTTVTANASTTITATAGTVSVTFTLNVGSSGGGSPTGGLKIVAGQGQLLFENVNTQIPGFGSPLTVKLTDINGVALANQPVTFSVSQGPGTLFNGQATPDGTGVIIYTDANGLAGAGFLSSTTPPLSGFVPTTVQVTAPGTNSVTFYMSTASRLFSPTAQFVQPDPGSLLAGSAGSVQKGAIVVKVISALGQPIPNVSIRLVDPSILSADAVTNAPSAYASCVDPTGSGVLTDSTGTAVCDVQFGGTVVTGQQLKVNVGWSQSGPGLPYRLNVTPGTPAAVRIIQGNNQTGNPGQTLTSAFVVQVSDAGGNVLPGAPVSFQVLTPSTITLQNVSSTTDVNGNASALGVLGNTGGTYQIKATSGTGSATFNFTVNIPASGIVLVSGSNQTAVTSTAFGSPLVVRVVNGSGAPVAGINVTFAVTSGSASLSAASVTTDASGQAQTTVTAGAGAGSIVVTATAATYTTQFNLTSRLPGPTNITFVNGSSFQPGISPGAIATIQGTGIAPGLQGVVQPSGIVGQLPTTLGGVSVSFNGVAAPIYSVSNVGGKEQVTVQVPFETPVGTTGTNVTINAAGGGTATINNVPIQPVAPGLFETQYSGQDFSVAIRQSDGTYISPSNPAHRGDVICTFASGLGQTSPALTTNNAGQANQNVLEPMDVGLNNAGVKLVSATTLFGVVGVYEVCLQVPTDALQGPRQPLGLIIHDPTVGDAFAQGSFIPIQ